MPVPELKPITNQISTLKMNNQPPRVLYETVGKLAGINVIFDPQYQRTTRNINLDLTNTQPRRSAQLYRVAYQNVLEAD